VTVHAPPARVICVNEFLQCLLRCAFWPLEGTGAWFWEFMTSRDTSPAFMSHVRQHRARKSERAPGRRGPVLVAGELVCRTSRVHFAVSHWPSAAELVQFYAAGPVHRHDTGRGRRHRDAAVLRDTAPKRQRFDAARRPARLAAGAELTGIEWITSKYGEGETIVVMGHGCNKAGK
jgi:hypothetical protein